MNFSLSRISTRLNLGFIVMAGIIILGQSTSVMWITKANLLSEKLIATNLPRVELHDNIANATNNTVALLTTQALPQVKQLHQTLSQATKQDTKQLYQDNESIHKNLSTLLILAWTWLVAGILFAVGAAYHMIHSITKPITYLVSQANLIADGQAVSFASEQHFATEFEQLRFAMLHMHQSMQAANKLARSSEARVQAIVETAAVAIITITDQGEVESFNNTAATIFGYTPTEIIGQNVRVLMPEPHHSAHGQYLKNYRNTGEKHIIGKRRSISGKRKNGEEFPIGLYVSEVKAPGQRIFTGIIQDLTEQISFQQQLLQSAKLASIGTLATGMAHELNQPIAYMRGEAQMVLADGKDNFDCAEAFEVLKLVVDGTFRMESIITHLREFAHNNATTPYEPIDLHTVIRSSFTLLKKQFENRGITILQQLAPDLPTVMGNSNQIEQVFINLLTNARDALEETANATITIQTWSDDDAAFVSFQDNGPGIPEKIAAKIFDPFFTTKEVGKGTGLGLSISYDIVEKHGGSIQLSTPPDQGAKFVIRLSIKGVEGEPNG